MSETPWLHGAAVEAGAGEQPATDRRRVALFGGLALAALAGVGALLLSGGPDEVALDQAAPVPVATPSAPGASASPSPAATPEFTDARTGRNPFLDPAPPPVAVVAPVSDDGAPVPNGMGGVPDVPQARPAPAAEPVQLPVTEDAPTPATSLSLLRVQGTEQARSAVFRLGGEQVTASVGDSFGSSVGLLLLSLQEGPEPGQWTAVVQVDQGDPFDVVTGTPVSLA